MNHSSRAEYFQRVVAGAVFGLYIAHLLYFLNPQIAITPGRLLSVTLVYGVICGVVFGSILWLLRLTRLKLGRVIAPPLETEPQYGIGFITAAAFFSAALYWLHLRIFRIYLPIGAVRILSKATNVIAGTAFVLMILWVIGRSLRGTRFFQAAAYGVILLSSLFLYQRREGYRADDRTTVVANIGTIAGTRRVLFVAIRNLPYDWLLTMTGEGSLRFFDTKSKGTFLVRIEPFPSSSPKAIWASLATGKLPHRHGVTGRFSYRTALTAPGERYLLLPSGVGFQGWGLIPPVERISAALPSGDSLPLWSMVHRVGFGSSVVNWPSFRNDSPRELLISEKSLEAIGAGELAWPARLGPGAAALRVSPEALPAEVSSRFESPARDGRQKILQALATDLTAVNVARLRSRSREDVVTVLALGGLAEAEGVTGIRDGELPPGSSGAGRAMRAYIEQLDRALVELAAEPGLILVVVSPSSARPPQIPGTASAMLTALVERRDPGSDDGFVLMAGDDMVPAQDLQMASVTDVVPTLLFAAGLPTGRDMDGRVLTEAFSDRFIRRTPLSLIHSYDARDFVARRE